MSANSIGPVPQEPLSQPFDPVAPQQAPQDPGLQAATSAAELARSEREKRRRQEQAGIFSSAVQANPADEAEKVLLAKGLNVPPNYISDTNLARMDKQARDLADLRAGNPELYGFLAHLPTVRMLHDDVGNLQLTSKTFDWWKRNYEVGDTANEGGYLKARLALARENKSDLSPTDKYRLEEIDRIQKMSAMESTGIFDEAAQLVGNMLKPALAAAAVGAVSGPAAPFTSGAVIFGHTAITEFGNEYDSIYQQLVEAGVPADEAHSEALRTAAAYGVGAAALEVVGFHALGKPFAAAGKKVFGQKLLGLAKPTALRASGTFLKETAIGGLSETLTEGAQEALGAIAENVAAQHKNVKELDSKAPTLGESLERIGTVMLKTAKGMAVLAPLGPALHYAADLERVKRSKGAAEMFTRVAENSTDSKVRERSPELYAAIVNAKAAGTDAENVYIEGPKLAQALESTGQSREQLAVDLPDVAKQLSASESSGEDIVIPMGDFAAKIAPTDLYPAIQKSIRIGKDGFSIDRAEEWLSEQQKNRDESAKLVAEAAAKTMDWDAQATRVEARLLQEIKKDTRIAPERAEQVAALHRQFIETQAAREGMTPEQFDATHRLIVTTDRATGKTVMQFAGERAETADLSSLARAKQMMAEDVDLEKIRQTTGWFLGEDGEWRFEFSDEGAKLKTLPGENAGALDLRDVLEHPKLFAAYPDLQLYRISTFKPTELRPEKGRFTPQTRGLELRGGMTEQESLSVLLHEIQHSIQQREGFARGGSPFEFTPDELTRLTVEKAKRDRGRILREDPGVVERHNKLVDQLNEARATYNALYDKAIAEKGARGPVLVNIGDSPEATDLRMQSSAFYADKNVQAIRDIERVLQDPEAAFDLGRRVTKFDAYQRLAGETEARNVQTRQSMTEEERQRTPPSATADIPSEDLILRNQEFKTFHEDTDQSAAAGSNEADQGAVQDTGGVRRGSELVDEQAGAQPDAPRLEGLPATVTVDGQEVAFGPSKEARAAAARYMQRIGLPYNPVRVYAPIDIGRARRIATAFAEMKHDPSDPQVKAAYEALARETIAQYEAMLSAGVLVEFNPMDRVPYAQPRHAMLDLQNNNHLYVFSTEDGYGQVGITDKDRAENPMLHESGFKFGDRPALINDLFRAVHDYFGHFKEGVGFRARGEENAWQQHMGMYSPLARKAATSETRGQNSWVNFGPHAQANKNASGADTVYAEQKVGLLPDWVVTEGYLGQEPEPTTTLGETAEGIQRLKQEAEARGEFDPLTNTIFLNENANPTTILHEMSHFWLSTLFKLASMPTASEAVKKDAAAVLSWFGVKDVETWNKMSLAEQERHHEAWAYNAEAHFFGEGKAPSINDEQRRMFRAFGRWIRSTYRMVRDVLNARYRRLFGTDLPGLTPDVRAVFDRMIASEDAIEAAKADRAMQPMFRTKPEGMSDPDWVQLQAAEAEANDTAVEDLQRESLRAMRWTENNESRMAKQVQRLTREMRKKVEEEERAKLEQEPLYRAQQQLRHGVTVDENGNTRPFKMSLQSVKNLGWVGDVTAEEAIAKLGTGPGGMLAENGLPIDFVASMFGFTSGATLVQQLTNAPPAEVVVQERANARMLAEHSDLMDPEKVRLMIEKALHNEARARMVAAELKFLQKITTPIRLMVRAAREFARETIGNTRIGDVKPHEHARAEVRNRREAERAMMKGDSVQAASFKRRELIEGQMEREALITRERIDDTQKLVRKLFRSDRKLAATRNVDYIAVARYLAAAFGLAPGERAVDSYVEQLRNYNPQMFEKLSPQIDRAREWAERALEEGRTVATWRDMTVDEFTDLSESMAALWNQSIREQQVIVNGRKLALDDVAGEVIAQDAKLPAAKPEPLGAKTGGELLARGFNRLKQLVSRPEHWAFRKDGAEKPGAFTRYFWRPIRDAVNRYVIDRNRYTKRIADMVKTLRPKLKLGLIEFRDPQGNLLYTFGRGNGGFGHAELVAALLHTGNRGNLERLLVGRGWGSLNKETGELDSTSWDAFVREQIAKGVITKDVMDFVQRVWDLNEEVKPIAQKAHRDLFGFYFKEIEPTALAMPWGTYRGGYMPAKLDKTAASAARIQSLQDLESDFRKQFATTGRGFTRERAEHFAEPLLLDINMVPAHIDDVLRFSHLQPAVRDVERIMNHKDVAAALEARQPGVRQNMLLPWLQRVASQAITRAGKSPEMDSFWRFLRSSAGLSTMFANLGNAMQQFTGIFTSALKVKPRYLAKGLWRLMSERSSMYADISEKSPFMANRQNNQVFDSLEAINGLMLNRSKFAKTRAWVRQHGYFLQSAFQNMVDAVTWSGAFEQSLAESGRTMSDADAQAEAVQRADAAVRMTQSSFDPSDVAHYEEGSPFYRIWTMFSGYFNTMANLQADQLVKMSRAQGWGKAGVAFGTYALAFAVPMLLAEAITRTVRGRWDDEDDDGDLDIFTFDYLFMSQLRSALAEIPVLGPAGLAPAVNMIDNQPWNDRMTTSPAVTVIEKAFGGTVDAVKVAAGLKHDRKGNVRTVDGDNIRDVTSLLGVLFGLPLSALGTRAGYVYDVSQGNLTPSGAYDATRSVISGAAGSQAVRERR